MVRYLLPHGQIRTRTKFLDSLPSIHWRKCVLIKEHIWYTHFAIFCRRLHSVRILVSVSSMRVPVLRSSFKWDLVTCWICPEMLKQPTQLPNSWYNHAECNNNRRWKKKTMHIQRFGMTSYKKRPALLKVLNVGQTESRTKFNIPSVVHVLVAAATC